MSASAGATFPIPHAPCLLRRSTTTGNSDATLL
jgi:hypothetical protein